MTDIEFDHFTVGRGAEHFRRRAAVNITCAYVDLCYHHAVSATVWHFERRNDRGVFQIS